MERLDKKKKMTDYVGEKVTLPARINSSRQQTQNLVHLFAAIGTLETSAMEKGGNVGERVNPTYSLQ